MKLIYDKIYPAASMEKLADLEKRLGVTLPESYRAYLGVQDGGTLGGYNNHGIEIILGIGDVPKWSSLWYLLDIEGDVIPKGYIPVGTDAGGSLFLLAVAGQDRGSVWYQSSELEEDDSGVVSPVTFERLADSWDAFLTSIKPQPITANERLIARGFWGPRQETPDQIADKLVTFLLALNKIFREDLPWSSHNLPAKLLTETTNAKQVISEAFQKNTDAPHLGINQAYDAQSKRLGKIHLTMNVGGYSDSPHIKNALVLNWHATDVSMLAEPILRQIISVWDPDWGSVTSQNLMRALAEVRPAGTRTPALGYLTYLSGKRAQTLPGDLDTLDNGGVILGAGEDGSFLPIEELIEYAKLLKPTEAFAPTPTSRSKL